MRPEKIGDLGCGAVAEQPLDRRHGGEKVALLCGGERAEHGGDLAMRAGVERANTFRPRGVSDRRLCRPSVVEARFPTRRRVSKRRRMRLR